MMEGGLSLGNLNALANLLKPADVDSESEDEEPKSRLSKLGPGDVGPKKLAKVTEETESKQDATSIKKDIWEEDEVPVGAVYDDVHDDRTSPEYEIIYSQAVTSEDMFLQNSNKSAATASCENMIVKIKLQDSNIKDVKLDVKPKYLDCRSPKYRLGLHLPHPVDSNNGKAEWNGKTETLSVTLRMKREYDFLNF